MPRHEPPFNKWGELQREQSQRDPASPEGTTDAAPRQVPRVKIWLLRSAWMISTGMLILGAGLIILILSGHAGFIGL